MTETQRIKITLENIPAGLTEDDAIRILARAMRVYLRDHGDAEEVALGDALETLDDAICDKNYNLRYARHCPTCGRDRELFPKCAVSCELDAPK